MVVAPVTQPETLIQPHPRPTVKPARRNKVLALAVMGLFFLAGLGAVVQTVRVNVLGYQLAQVRREVAALERANERLELEVARLKDPARLAQIARTTLGLVEPDSSQVEYVSSQALAQARVAVQSFAEVASGEERPPTVWQRLAEALVRWREGGPGRIAEK